MTIDARPRFTCPVCGAISYNPNDIEHGYCGACHAFTGKGVDEATLTVKEAMAWFGVSRATVQRWIGMYRLRPVSGRDWQTRTYTLSDLADADLHARTGTGPMASRLARVDRHGG